MSFSVDKMLKLSVFEGANLITNHEGLGNTVSGITVLDDLLYENPSIKNQAVLGSAGFLRRLLLDGIDCIAQCINQQAACLIIVANRESNFITQEALLAAQTSHFPVVLVDSSITFSQIIDAVTFEILHVQGYDQSLSFQENFFQELLSAANDRDTIIKRGSMLGLRRDEHLCAVLLQSDDQEQAQVINEFCRNRWERECFVLTHNGRVMVALRLTVSEIDKGVIIDITQDLINRLQAENPEMVLNGGIGRCCSDLLDFKKSFFEACSALSFSSLPSRKNLSHFDDLGIYRIIFDYKNREELFKLYRETVGTIVSYDRKNNTNYMETIQVFFDQGLSVNNTAKKLFIHYNTVLYRIKKIKAIFGINLYDENDRINISVCLQTANTQELWRTF